MPAEHAPLLLNDARATASPALADWLKSVAKRVMPASAWSRLRAWKQSRAIRPRLGRVRMGMLRRTTPISRKFGLDRGGAIDRYYIEQFLDKQRADIRGRVLEIGDREYTERFGDDRVTQSDVLHAIAGNPTATIVGDLQTGDGVPTGAFDCIILTQVLPFVIDVRGAIASCHRALRPGGVILATIPGVSQISRYDMDRWGDYWRFTSLSAAQLFVDPFGGEAVTVTSYGNVLAAAAFLYGMGARDLRESELDVHDADYEVTITVRAVKPETTP